MVIQAKVLVDQVEVRLKQIILEVAQELEVEILEMETDKDHIHILAEVDPSFGVMKFIRTAKGRSSRLLRQEFAHLRTRLPTLWTNSCFISSVGGAPLEVIKQYIANQQNSERPKQKNKWKAYVNQPIARPAIPLNSKRLTFQHSALNGLAKLRTSWQLQMLNA